MRKEKSPTFLNPANLLTVNQEIELTITSLSHGGSGVGRFDDFVVFVPFTAPHDVARVQILNLKKNYAEGKLLEIISSSNLRAIPQCSVFGQCGGCQWQNIKYSEQLHQKQLIVEHALSRIAKEDRLEILPIISALNPYHYRNRAQVRAEGSKVGFYQRGSHHLVEFEKCWIVDDKINVEIEKIKLERKNLDEFKTSKIEIFLTEKGEVHRSLNRSHGDKTGFSQVNTSQNLKMQEYICSLLPTPRKVDADNVGSNGNLLDLYCGNGNFSLPLSNQGWRIYGVDNNRNAINAAREKRNDQTFYSVNDCHSELQKLVLRKRKFEAILIDPPRIGVYEAIWPDLAKLGAEQIIYVSCNPATFARDWSRLRNKSSYKLLSVQPFDMFPQTFHVELVAQMSAN